MKRNAASGILLTLLITGMLTLPIAIPSVKAIEDPTVSGSVRDKSGNPISNVLIEAQDTSTGTKVASTTSDTIGRYSMSVPQDTYNLIVTPPLESGFANTTIPNVEITMDTVIDIVLVPAQIVVFSGQVVDRDSIAVPKVSVSVYDGVSAGNSTNSEGFFSMRVPVGSYSLSMSHWTYESNTTNVPRSFSLWRYYRLNMTEDTFMTFRLQNRYISGKVLDPNGSSVANVSISASGSTYFSYFSGWFETWTKSDGEGNFNIAVLNSTSVSLRATPPPDSPYGATLVSVNATEDVSVTVTLSETFVFSGEVKDRDGDAVPKVSVSVYDGVSAGNTTDNQGLFSMRIPTGSYSLSMSHWAYGDNATNVPRSFSLWRYYRLNITQDTFMSFTLQNRYISGMVTDPYGNPVANVSIQASGSSYFSYFSGWFETWTKSDGQGSFNIAVLNSTSVSLRATPPSDSPYGAAITQVDATEDTTITVTLSQTVVVSGLVVDRDGRAVPRVSVSMYDGVSVGNMTNSQGLFSMRAPTGSYSLSMSHWAYESNATNVPQSFSLWRYYRFNVTQDTFVTFTLQNRYLLGKVVDPDGNPVANVSISVSGSTYFDYFSGWFETWTKSDREGNFGVAVFNSTSLSLRATPPPDSPYGPVSISTSAYEDKTIILALVYKPGTRPVADFTWTPLILKVGELVTFDASASIPREGEIVSYEWDFGDGNSASGRIAPHTYPSAGQYTVTLNVTDSEGLWDTIQKQIEIETPPVPPTVRVTIDVHPQSLNLWSKGRWVTAYIELPEGYSVADINVSTVTMDGPVSAMLKPVAIGDYDNDTVPDLMVKFDRAEVTQYLLEVVEVDPRFITVTLTLTGKLEDGTQFQGSYAIRTISTMPRSSMKWI